MTEGAFLIVRILIRNIFWKRVHLLRLPLGQTTVISRSKLLEVQKNVIKINRQICLRKYTEELHVNESHFLAADTIEK